MMFVKAFYLTYKGKGSYNVGKYSFVSGKTLEVDEKTYKRLISPLFSGRIGKVKREEPVRTEIMRAEDEPEVVKVEDKPKDRKGKKDKKG